MSFIELAGIDDVSEKKTVPEGSYDVVVTANPKAKKNEESGKINLLVVLAIEGHPEAANILHNLALPGAEDEPESRKFKLLMIKRFCHHFKIDMTGGQLNTENFAGARMAQCPVVKDEFNNVVSNKLKVPPLPIEE
jgi:hypothetical protein